MFNGVIYKKILDKSGVAPTSYNLFYSQKVKRRPFQLHFYTRYSHQEITSWTKRDKAFAGLVKENIKKKKGKTNARQRL